MESFLIPARGRWTGSDIFLSGQFFFLALSLSHRGADTASTRALMPSFKKRKGNKKNIWAFVEEGVSETCDPDAPVIRRKKKKKEKVKLLDGGKKSENVKIELQ